MIVFVADLISIHALREESDKFEGDDHGIDAKISIHALREEGDAASAMTPLHTGHFNPRSPWGERREQEIIIRAALEFQSTLSVGRATKGAQHTVIGLVLFQSTPSARRATCSGSGRPLPTADFNPRPPRGGRQGALQTRCGRVLFQSTPSARRATQQVAGCCNHRGYFNPRPPRGGRP